LRNRFNSIDANWDGNVTKTELKARMMELGEEFTDGVVDRMISMVDENGDGMI